MCAVTVSLDARPPGRPLRDLLRGPLPLPGARCWHGSTIPLSRGRSTTENIHNEVRRRIGTYPFTTITGVNWRHGSDRYTQHETGELLKHGLVIHFSRPVLSETLRRGVIDVYHIESRSTRHPNIIELRGEIGFDLRLMSSLNDVRGIPTEGKNLIIVAAVNNVLHFRVFDDDGKVVVDTDEKRLTEQARQIEDLRKQLESLWPPHELTRSDKDRVITAVTSIVGHTQIEHATHATIEHHKPSTTKRLRYQFRHLEECPEPGDRVLIVVRCAFILDECCRPVDGLNVGGRVPYVDDEGRPHPDERPPAERGDSCQIPPWGYGPWTSGNGTGGGTFESWFYVEEGRGS